MKTIELNDDIKMILNILQEYGQGYIVGGYVRDALLGLQPKDCDFLTNIAYDKLIDIFSKYKPIQIGKHFGVLQITVNNVQYEIAKMRQDIGIPEDRKEQSVEFTDNIYEDLQRRDFTINAIAYDGVELFTLNQLSFNDVYNKIIRFIGEPTVRITEDPLRIMRAFRLSSQKGMPIERQTLDAISKCSDMLFLLAKERIRDEIEKILESDNKCGLKYMYLTGCFDKIFTNVAPVAFEKVLNTMYSINDFKSRICLLNSYLVKDLELFRELKFSNKALDMLFKVNQSFEILRHGSNKKIALKQAIKNCGYDFAPQLLDVYHMFSGSEIFIVKELLEEIKSEPVFIKDLDITGNDLLNKCKPTDIGATLEYLLQKVHQCPELNKKELLLGLVQG